jgi:NTE family protein
VAVCTASRTDALEKALENMLFGKMLVGEVKRRELSTVINACELRTGTAFRFGHTKSGSWRTGQIVGNKVTVAHAVACSAAYTMMLPAFDRIYEFEKNGKNERKRVLITDGGVFDNLGVSCIEPGRDSAYSLHTFDPDYIICCNAGHGQLSGENIGPACRPPGRLAAEDFPGAWATPAICGCEVTMAVFRPGFGISRCTVPGSLRKSR